MYRNQSPILKCLKSGSKTRMARGVPWLKGLQGTTSRTNLVSIFGFSRRPIAGQNLPQEGFAPNGFFTPSSKHIKLKLRAIVPML